MPYPLSGLRVLDCSLLGPGATGMHLADLGAEVIKIEAPGSGDYVRKMAFPIVEGTSLLHWHINRGKLSVAIDLRTDAGVELFLDLVRFSDVVIEAMRPGALDRRGLTYARMRAINPRIVYCHISGYGMTGPYRDLPSHGYAYDAWAGVARPTVEEHGFPSIPAYTTIGIHAGPLYAALGILAGVVRARASGIGCEMEVAQSDAAAAFNWNGIEGNKAHERPESEVTGNDGDGKAAQRRDMGEATMKESVRYQFYHSADGYVLLMASEREFWKNFCDAVGRPELFEQHPGAKFGDHARGNLALRQELTAIFKTRTTTEWVELGKRANVPLGPVNNSKTIADDPQFQNRLPWLPYHEHGTDLMPSPIKLIDEKLPTPTKAPIEVGRDTYEVLRRVLGYDRAKLDEVRASGALGPIAS